MVSSPPNPLNHEFNQRVHGARGLDRFSRSLYVRPPFETIKMVPWVVESVHPNLKVGENERLSLCTSSVMGAAYPWRESQRPPANAVRT
jgi:hypothetical protein